MGRLVYGMGQSLDGYVAGPAGGPQPNGIMSAEAIAEMGLPSPAVFRHFTEHIRGVSGMLYGRRLYEIMCYWDKPKRDWDEIEHEYGQAWRAKPKWVASRSLQSVGPNATLVRGDLIDFVKRLKTQQAGDIDVAGAEIASVLSTAGLIDEYRLYLRPHVLGGGKPFFASSQVPRLRLMSHEVIGDDVVRLIYVPA
jgi:dihydrofolate reductase